MSLFPSFIFVLLTFCSVYSTSATHMPVDARNVAVSTPSPTTSTPSRTGSRTAHAVIHFDDDIWGSAVFHQWHPDGPVVISMLFQNIKARPNQVIDYAIHESPVLYDKYDHDPSQMCTPSALKSVLKQGSNPIGALSSNHRPIVGQRHADVIYDYNIKLYEGMDNYVINKSFVIRQGDSGVDHRCATIVPSNLGSQKAGAIPCEFQRYPDCLVGAVGNTKKCVFKPCVGFRQYWSDTHFVNESTLMCKQVKEWYPKPNMALPDSAQRVGTVDCTHGQHTLLSPIGPHSEI